jgi:hypothetical protein
MHSASFLAGIAMGLVCLQVQELGAQASSYPPISKRDFVGGSIKVKVTGSFQIDEEVAINAKASFGSGDMTWLQFGDSGSDEPNALITFTTMGETGITVGRGKLITTGGIMPGEKSQCTGKAEVTAKQISGRYTCKGISSYDPVTSKMGKVDIEVNFTAKS